MLRPNDMFEGYFEDMWADWVDESVKCVQQGSEDPYRGYMLY